MNSAVAPRSADVEKLPLWKTIGLAYSTYFHCAADVLRISWLWLVLCVPLVNIATMAQLSLSAYGLGEMNFGAAAPPMPARWSMPIDVMVLGNISGLVALLASVSIAVAWHRRIILDEHPALSGSNVATKSFWRYAGTALEISLTMFPGLVFLLLLTLFAGSMANSGYTGLIQLVFIPVFILVFAFSVAVILRLSLLLPARAVGDLELTFRQTWIATRRNTWRLFWGIMICMILPLLFLDFVLIILGGSRGPGGFQVSVHHMVGTIVFLTLTYLLLMLPIGMGFLSLAYRHFFGRA
jgi:hypothetical protein